MTLVTVAAIVVGLALFFEFGGPSAEVVDRVGIVDGWTLEQTTAFPSRATGGHEANDVVIVGPEGHVVEAYWSGTGCDTASRVTVEGTPEALRLLVELRNPRPLGGCDDAAVPYRLTLVANRVLPPGSVSGEVVGSR